MLQLKNDKDLRSERKIAKKIIRKQTWTYLDQIEQNITQETKYDIILCTIIFTTSYYHI